MPPPPTLTHTKLNGVIKIKSHSSKKKKKKKKLLARKLSAKP